MFACHPGRTSESMSPGTRAACVGMYQVHEVVLLKEAETCRGGTSIEGQRSFGRAYCGTGEGRNIVCRQGAEVSGVGSGRESRSVSIHNATTISRARRVCRVESHARHHRLPSRRVGEVAPWTPLQTSTSQWCHISLTRVDPTTSGHDRRRTENTMGSHGRTRTGFQQRLASALRQDKA